MTAGEVPPKDMLNLLTEWGVGDNLAHALLAHFGGHGRLVIEKEGRLTAAAVRLTAISLLDRQYWTLTRLFAGCAPRS
jgi:hypothetical protein